MNTLRFNTNINCANCVRAVTPTLNGEPAITAWQVDTEAPNKVLTVTSDLSEQQLVALIADAGFQAEKV